MSSARRTLLVVLVAILGIAVAAAITWGTSQLVRQRIGLASEPLTAGRRLLPALPSTQTATSPTTSATPAPRKGTTSTQSEPASPPRTSSAPAATATTPATTEAPATTQSATQPSQRESEGGSGETRAPSSGGSQGGGQGGGRDSQARRDD